MENKVIVEQGKLEPMKKEGKKINKWCHFSRNNPRTVYYYYNWLIGLFGYDNWEKGNALFKRQWESAKYSFDKMYGLVKGWYTSETTLTLTLPEEKDSTVEALLHRVNTLTSENDELKKRLESKDKDIQLAVEELKKATEEVKKAKAVISLQILKESEEGDE